MLLFLLKQTSSDSSASVPILSHPQVPDVLLLPVDGPRYVRNPGAFGGSCLLSVMSMHLVSGVWSSSAQRWWWGLSVAMPYSEEPTSSPQGSSPAPNVWFELKHILKLVIHYEIRFDCVLRHEGGRCCVRLLRSGGQVYPRSSELPGEQGVCGKWSCRNGSLKYFLHRWTSQVLSLFFCFLLTNWVSFVLWV